MHEEIKDEGEGKEDELEDGPGMDSPSLSLSLSLGSRPFLSPARSPMFGRVWFSQV